MRDSEDFQQNSRSSGPPVEHPAALWSIFRSSHPKLRYAVTTWNVHESDERLVVLRTRRRATCIATQLPGARTHFQPLVLWSVYTNSNFCAIPSHELCATFLPRSSQAVPIMDYVQRASRTLPPTRDFQIPPIWNQAVASERHQESASTS